MSFVTVGISHKTAPVEIREKLVFSSENVDLALKDLVKGHAAQEAALLSTCNRTEIYCAKGDVGRVLGWWSRWHRFDIETMLPFAYQHQGQTAVSHLMRVACGLDSLVLGETQILGQLKQAYQQANQAGVLGHSLTRLFQCSFQVAKQIRTETDIGLHPVSVAYTATRLANQIFSNIKESRVLCIGAGDTITLCARHLIEQGVSTIYFANRTLERGKSLVDMLNQGHHSDHPDHPQLNLNAVPLTDLSSILSQVDIVISSTASSVPILGKGRVETALKQRKRKPMLMIDLAVPRDIEPEVSALEDVYLYSIDDLQHIITQNQSSRVQAAIEAEKIIATKVTDFMNWHQQRKVVPQIQSIRGNVERLKLDVLHEAKMRLGAGHDPIKVIEWSLGRLSNKILHEPTITLREKCTNVETIQLIEELFKH